nr:glycine cleavage system transcriptional activator GcvA [Raoultella sp. NCTC 9187]
MKKTEQSAEREGWAESGLANDPPLRAVRAFEAIARLGSITLAAQELAISPSAVSHQLKVLEDICRSRLPSARGDG